MNEDTHQPGYRFAYACCLALCLAAIHIGLIVKLDNTNLSTTNGLWKTPAVSAWEHGTGTPLDSGGFLYLPVYGYLSRLVPDRAVSYSIHGEVVTYRKLAMWNAIFGALASTAVFLMALRLTASIARSLIVSLAHASSAFVLVCSLGSEDVIPAYAFFAASAALLAEYLMTRKTFSLMLAAIFLAFTTLFHWTLMIPAGAGFVFVLLAAVRNKRRLMGSALLFLAAFLAVIKISVRILAAISPNLIPVRTVIFSPKAVSVGGWVGFRWEKMPGVLVGIGNYFCGGFNPGNYRQAFADSTILKMMAVSWVYLLVTGSACLWALWSRRSGVHAKLMALFGVIVFSVGELEHFYAQPQEAQSQIQPMFITVIGLVILLDWIMKKPAASVWQSLALLAAFTMNGALNLHSMFLTRGQDSESVRSVKELSRVFSPNDTIIVSHGWEGWNTWVYVDTYRGNRERYLDGNILLSSAFADHAGISGTEAALLMRSRIQKALDDRQQVAAYALWTQDREDFVGSLTALADHREAGVYYDLLRSWFDVGQSWNTPLGRFVEIRNRPGARARVLAPSL